MRTLSISSIEVRVIVVESSRAFIVGQRDDIASGDSEGQSKEKTGKSASELQSSLFEEATNIDERTREEVKVRCVNSVISGVIGCHDDCTENSAKHSWNSVQVVNAAGVVQSDVAL